MSIDYAPSKSADAVKPLKTMKISHPFCVSIHSSCLWPIMLAKVLWFSYNKDFYPMLTTPVTIWSYFPVIEDFMHCQTYSSDPAPPKQKEWTTMKGEDAVAASNKIRVESIRCDWIINQFKTANSQFTKHITVEFQYITFKLTLVSCKRIFCIMKAYQLKWYSPYGNPAKCRLCQEYNYLSGCISIYLI